MLDGIVHILSGEPDMLVVGTGGSAAEAIELAQRELPDLMLLDMNMPGDGLSAIARIAEFCPNIRIIALTVRSETNAIRQALALGVRAYVLKGVGSGELLSILRGVHAGMSHVSTSLASKLIEDKPQLTPLTLREQQILDGISRGLSNKEIANELELQEKTIKHYVTNVLQKLQVRNRVEAALLVREGVVGGPASRPIQSSGAPAR